MSIFPQEKEFTVRWTVDAMVMEFVMTVRVTLDSLMIIQLKNVYLSVTRIQVILPDHIAMIRRIQVASIVWTVTLVQIIESATTDNALVSLGIKESTANSFQPVIIHW